MIPSGQLRIAVVGVGKLGSSLANLLHKNGHQMTLIDTDPTKLDKFEINLTNRDNYDVAFVCVKPYQAQEAIYGLKSKTIVSTIASLDINKIERWTDCKNIFRCMPNLPISEGLGSLVWYGPSTPLRSTIDVLLKGPPSVWVKTECQIDLATSLLGSGPGYFKYIYDHLKKLGQDIPEIDKLLKGMIEGTLKINSPNLINDVSTKGGVTESIISSFEENGLGSILEKGINTGIHKINTLKKNQ